MKSELLFLFETHQVSSSKCICSMRVATGSCLCTLAPIRQMSLTRWDCIISASRRSWVGVPMNAGLLLGGRLGRVPEGTCGETTAFPFKRRNGSSNPHFQIKHEANWPHGCVLTWKVMFWLAMLRVTAACSAWTPFTDATLSTAVGEAFVLPSVNSNLWEQSLY